MTTTPSISNLADEVLLLVRGQGSEYRDAITEIATVYGISTKPIARELALRSKSHKDKLRRERESDQTKEINHFFEERLNSVLLKGARQHETEMRDPFEDCDHLDDYY